MDKGTRQVKKYIRYQQEIRMLMDMSRIKFKETDTLTQNCKEVSKDAIWEFCMDKWNRGDFW